MKALATCLLPNPNSYVPWSCYLYSVILCNTLYIASYSLIIVTYISNKFWQFTTNPSTIFILADLLCTVPFVFGPQSAKVLCCIYGSGLLTQLTTDEHKYSYSTYQYWRQQLLLFSTYSNIFVCITKIFWSNTTLTLHWFLFLFLGPPFDPRPLQSHNKMYNHHKFD